MDSLYQTVNGLVGNVDWGESLTVAACEFRGLNKGEGGIRRGIEWLNRGEFLQSILGKRIFPEDRRKEGARREGKKTGGGG